MFRRPTIHYTLHLITVWLLTCTAAALADVPAAQQHEVQHLLTFIGKSDCTLIRNGKPYTGEEALAHIERKYDYLKKKITTTEKFIELSASSSSMSGRDYRVRCPGAPEIKSRDWLMRELWRYRQQPPEPNLP